MPAWWLDYHHHPFENVISTPQSIIPLGYGEYLKMTQRCSSRKPFPHQKGLFLHIFWVKKTLIERETWIKSFVSLFESVFSGGFFSKSQRKKRRATASIFEAGT